MTDTLIYKVFGGPDAGKIAEVPKGSTQHWAYRETVAAAFVAPDSEAPEMPKFNYVLAPAPDGGSAFVPEADADLLGAYQSTDGEPGNPEADALAAEIQRRGLDL